MAAPRGHAVWQPSPFTSALFPGAPASLAPPARADPRGGALPGWTRVDPGGPLVVLHRFQGGTVVAVLAPGPKQFQAQARSRVRWRPSHTV